MTALIASIVATVIMTGAVVYIGRRRKPGTPLTWGEAFVAALFVFVFMLLLYGIWPNQWILYANNTLTSYNVLYAGSSLGMRYVCLASSINALGGLTFPGTKPRENPRSSATLESIA